MKTTQNHKLCVNKVDVFQFCFGLHAKKKNWSHALLAEWLLQHKLILRHLQFGVPFEILYLTYEQPRRVYNT